MYRQGLTNECISLLVKHSQANYLSLLNPTLLRTCLFSRRKGKKKVHFVLFHFFLSCDNKCNNFCSLSNWTSNLMTSLLISYWSNNQSTNKESSSSSMSMFLSCTFTMNHGRKINVFYKIHSFFSQHVVFCWVHLSVFYTSLSRVLCSFSAGQHSPVNLLTLIQCGEINTPIFSFLGNSHARPALSITAIRGRRHDKRTDLQPLIWTVGFPPTIWKVE